MTVRRGIVEGRPAMIADMPPYTKIIFDDNGEERILRNDDASPEIKKLADQTEIMSSPMQMQNCPAYKMLKAKGRDALPELFAALEDGDAIIPVMMLLNEITGETVDAPPGDTEAMRAAWLKQADVVR